MLKQSAHAPNVSTSRASPRLPIATHSSLDLEIRRAAGLAACRDFHPPGLHEFFRQDDAIQRLRSLIESGQYASHELGLFAKEVNGNGSRKFIVDTHAGFALKHCPPHKIHTQADHFYEVILEGRPCWLYFDLEFSRVENPNCDVNQVIGVFYEMLDRFCKEVFALSLDHDSLIELDSTTHEKFSKHVIVKRLKRKLDESQDQEDSLALAFANNAQAGLVVSEFVSFLRSRWERAADSITHQLFFQSQKKGDADEASSASTPRKDCRLVSVVDECVYSRNRCFRLLFSSKFGRQRPLLFSKGADFKNHEALQLLGSMAACVPDGTELFIHSLIPAGYSHAAVGKRMRVDVSSSPKVELRHMPDEDSLCPLYQHLIEYWDKIRWEKDPESAKIAQPPTRVQSSVIVGEIPHVYLSITISHNRFCFCKGSSHKSNSIYLVINPRRCVFYQKCHDVDCRGFRSEETAIPKDIFDAADVFGAIAVKRPKPAASCHNDMSPVKVPKPKRRGAHYSEFEKASADVVNTGGHLNVK